MHPLLMTTRRSAVDLDAAYPHGSNYDFVSGVWQGPNGLVCDDVSLTPQTKKADLETGEDQKGQ